jgi:glutamate synthase domain-containing protein 3
MTGGVVVVLGPTGYNFAAGMSGGIAYVYDEAEQFGTRCNLDMVDLESVWTDEDRTRLRSLIERHAEVTGSPVARAVLDDCQARSALFVKVMPIEYRRVLERIEMRADRDAETVSATEEVYHG